MNPDGTPGAAAGGSVYMELDDLRGVNPSMQRGMNGETIESTPETTLRHELAHAVHCSQGIDNPMLTEFGNDAHEPRELSAISHENDARRDLGLPLRAANYRPVQ